MMRYPMLGDWSPYKNRSESPFYLDSEVPERGPVGQVAIHGP